MMGKYYHFEKNVITYVERVFKFHNAYKLLIDM